VEAIPCTLMEVVDEGTYYVTRGYDTKGEFYLFCDSEYENNIRTDTNEAITYCFCD
jgi:hypothetical protein